MALNQGQIYEKLIQTKLRNRNLLPNNLESNDAGFIKKGKAFFVEVKNVNAPDFGQKGLVWDKVTKSWNWRKFDIISQFYEAFNIRQYIDKTFIPRRYSVEPKEKLTEQDREFDQKHFEKSGISLTNIKLLYEFYARKRCFYIQIENRGLFYLKNDEAQLNVPQLNLPLTLRLRAKTHHSFPIHKYSFFAVIQANTNNLPISPFDIEGKVGKFPTI